MNTLRSNPAIADIGMNGNYSMIGGAINQLSWAGDRKLAQVKLADNDLMASVA
jgi:hypothetical protein